MTVIDGHANQAYPAKQMRRDSSLLAAPCCAAKVALAAGVANSAAPLS